LVLTLVITLVVSVEFVVAVVAAVTAVAGVEPVFVASTASELGRSAVDLPCKVSDGYRTEC
jgi:hypothetical protein